MKPYAKITLSMMKNPLKFLPILLLLASACSGIRVTSDYDKTVDFSQYKTFEYYGWEKNSDKILSPFDKERIEKAFGNEFAKRRLEQVDKGSGGDLIVTLYVITKEKKIKTAHTTHLGGYGRYYGYGPGWSYGPGFGASTTTITEYEYIEGTLVVSVYDAKEKKLIWEGVGTKTIDEKPETREKTIPKAAAAIMQAFPIRPIE